MLNNVLKGSSETNLTLNAKIVLKIAEIVKIKKVVCNVMKNFI